MNRIRNGVSSAFKKRWVRVSVGATAMATAIILSDTAMALAVNDSGKLSDRRLKKAIRAI